MKQPYNQIPDASALDLTVPIGPQIVRLLRDSIIQAEMKPGMRLSEQEIATRYALSRQPVREAFIKLAEEGLLEIRPQRGSFVRKISIGEVMDARFIREAIEADIVRELTGKIGPRQIKELEQQIALQREVINSDTNAFLAMDEQFHRTLAAMAGKVRVWDVLENLKAQMDRVRYLSLEKFAGEKLVEQHQEIVSALAEQDTEKAVSALRTHMRNLLQDLPAIAASHTDYFDLGNDDPSRKLPTTTADV